MVWYFHLFQNFPQFIVIHTVKGFGIINKAETDVFLELSCFFDDSADVYNLISGSSAFSCVQFFATLWTVVCQAPLSMGISQARILEWIAISCSRGSSQPRD